MEDFLFCLFGDMLVFPAVYHIRNGCNRNSRKFCNVAVGGFFLIKICLICIVRLHTKNIQHKLLFVNSKRRETVNFRAILHLQDSRYCYALDEKTVRVMLRVSSEDNFDGIKIIYGNKYDYYLVQQSE